MKNIRSGLPCYSLILIFVLTAFAVIYLQTEVVCMEYEITQLQAKKASLLKEKKIINAHLERLYSCKNIEVVAVQKLKMQPSNRENVYYLKRASSVTLAKNTIMKKGM
jgi:cell division protein FtsL